VEEGGGGTKLRPLAGEKEKQREGILGPEAVNHAELRSLDTKQDEACWCRVGSPKGTCNSGGPERGRAPGKTCPIPDLGFALLGK
jgi:hypothetical protein